ncbi:MAG: FAD-binding protein [Deltaproteobacteria bacterium]|nr:FAD-binding protein [Deltaproteobacteria bacterium]
MNLMSKLAEIVGRERVFDDLAERISNSRDMSVHQGVPELIVHPAGTEEISKIMKLANQEKVPVTARGSGTSVTGAVLPVCGGILMDLSRMNKIKHIDKANFHAVVEPGVICAHLNAALAKEKMFFPPDPGSSAIATLGGMVSTNASGLRAVKYGTTKDYVHALEVVLADGSIIKTGTTAPKTATGYDLTRLLVNSEGTLGIITEVTVRILPLPPYTAFAMALFDNLDDSGRAVTEILTSGIQLCACEIMDRASLNVVKKRYNLDISDAEALIIMEVDGHKAAVQEQMIFIEETCKKHHGMDVRWSDDPNQRAQMWQGRAGLVPALSRLKPGYRLVPISEDFGVPLTKIPEAIRGAQQVAAKYDVIISTFGHAGDGNVHTTFVIDLTDKSQWDRLRPASDELVDLAMKLKGTISAEHGTGLTRSGYIRRELGQVLDVMKTIKQALDPNNILNPDKMGFAENDGDIFDHFAFEPLIKGIAEANSFGTDVNAEVLACVQCGFCRNGCPTFSTTGLESFNARGRNILAFQMMTGQLEPGPELANTLYRCTTCGTCTYFCPAQIKVPQIVKKARERLYQAGLLPENYAAVLENIRKTNNPFASSKEDRVSSFPPDLREAIAKGTLPRQAETLLFMGCVPSYVDMKIVPSLIKNLSKAGVQFTALAMNEICCGLPIYLSGSDEFAAHADRVMAMVKETGAKEIVTPCAGCYHTLHDLYPGFSRMG